MDRVDQSPSSLAATGLPPIGLPGSGIRFRLHLKATRPGTTSSAADPLAVQASGAAPFKAYLASVEAAGKDLVPFVTVLLQPNEYPGVRGTTSQPGATNVQMEKTWREALSALRAGPIPGIAGLDRHTMAGMAELPATGPLAFCRKTHATIEPVCSTCRGRLSLCRDETLLRTSGLPSFASSLSRYLYCAACASADASAPTFYTYSLRDSETVPPGIKVRRRGELYRDLATSIQIDARPPDAEHYCFECPHRGECYPTGRSVDAPVPAEDLLFPLAYYGSFYLAVDPHPFDFNQAAALLGGSSPADLALSSTAVLTPPTQLETEALARLDTSGGQFFFEGDQTGLFALEVLYLKLAAFTRLARGIRDLHRGAGRPHLAIAPDRVRGRLDRDESSFLPARWGLTLSVGDLLSTAPLQLFDPIPGEPRVWAIPYPLPEPFVPDGLSRIQSESLFMRLAVRNLETKTQAGVTVAHLTCDLTADGYRDSDHGRHDLVRLSADTVPGVDGRLVFAGRKVGTIARGFTFEGQTGPLSQDTVRTLDPARLPASWSVEVSIVHTFSSPADVMSLGVLLLRLLLTNDRQDGSLLNREHAERLASAALTPSGAAHPGTAGLLDAFAAGSLKADASQVVFRESDRAIPAAIPDVLWHDSLDLALRMASNIPGRSLCASQDDFDPLAPAAPLDRALEELEMLAERARGGLVGSSGRNGLVQEVCDDFLADYRGALQAGMQARSSGDAPQMTVVVQPPRRSS